jgi:hypothetical protein
MGDEDEQQHVHAPEWHSRNDVPNTSEEDEANMKIAGYADDEL